MAAIFTCNEVFLGSIPTLSTKLMVMNYKIGQKVIALVSSPCSRSQQRTKGCIYTVHDVSYCSKTGTQAINIGEHTKGHLYECHCGGLHETNGLSWTFSSLFAPVEEKPNTEEAVYIEDLLKNSTYETKVN